MQNKRATIVAVGVFLFLGGCDFDDRNVDSAESSRSVNLVSEEGEPDPSAPIDAQYSVVFPPSANMGETNGRPDMKF